MPSRHPVVGALCLCLVLASVLLVACGSDSDDDDSSPTTVATTVAELPIIAKDFEFLPSEQRVKAGSISIQFENQGAERHTYSIYSDAEYTELEDTTTGVNPDSTVELELSLEAGEYFVRCDLHPTQMEATLTVE